MAVRSAMWRDLVPVAALDAGHRDTFVDASWLKGADCSRELRDFLQLELSRLERMGCGVEGWILGRAVPMVRIESPAAAKSRLPPCHRCAAISSRRTRS